MAGWIALTGIASAAVLVGVIGLFRHHRSVARKHQVEALFQAATAGDADWVRHLVETQGHPASVQDADGYTALHLAYYWRQQRAVSILLAFGADTGALTNDGISPSGMAQLASTEELLLAGVRCLAPWGGWLDPANGRFSYDRLREGEPRIYATALPLVWSALRSYHDRWKLVRLAIKLGMPAAEPWLARVLQCDGTLEMASDYLKSGSSVLSGLALSWLRGRRRVFVNGILVHSPRSHLRHGPPPASWGQF